MHVHLPKPLHGWREFVGEVGIIMLGVLLALGAEQLLEQWRWREAIRREKIALDQDVTTDWRALDGRRIIEPCVLRRLADVGHLLDLHDGRRAARLNGPLGRPTVWLISRSGLDMAIADGTLAHMRTVDRSAYFEVAEEAAFFERAAFDERDSWRVLNRLNNVPNLSLEDWRDVRNAYQNALDSDRVMRANLASLDPSQWMWGFRVFPTMPRNLRALSVPQVRDLCRGSGVLKAPV